MRHISNEQVEHTLDYAELITALENAYATQGITVGKKGQHQLSEEDSFLLMPSWSADFLGTKLMAVIPGNPKQGLSSHQGIYILQHRKTGEVACTMDAATLTLIRTACTSALASKQLSRKESKSLLVIGTGPLAKHMAIAHSVVRQIEQVYVWGRDHQKANTVVEQLSSEAANQVSAIKDLKQVLSTVDIISLATSATSPILMATDVVAGQHIDAVGSFKPTMKEFDSGILSKASVYCDELEGTPRKAGEFVKAIQEGSFQTSEIKGDLHFLASNGGSRKSQDEITLFKSTGMAIQDLVAAELIYQKLIS